MISGSTNRARINGHLITQFTEGAGGGERNYRQKSAMFTAFTTLTAVFDRGGCEDAEVTSGRQARGPFASSSRNVVNTVNRVNGPECLGLKGDIVHRYR